MSQSLNTPPFDTADSAAERSLDRAGDPRDELISSLQERVARLEKSQTDVEPLHKPRDKSGSQPGSSSFRARSSRKLFGCPLYDIAFGPDPETGAKKGHAKGIIAIGDYATGVIAIGGLAQGFVAIGGLSWGVFAVGGCTLALAAGVGGVAFGGYVLGGVAIGVQAFCGVAISLWPALSAYFSTGATAA